jgi:hypothetical protein
LGIKHKKGVFQKAKNRILPRASRSHSMSGANHFIGGGSVFFLGSVNQSAKRAGSSFSDGSRLAIAGSASDALTHN